MTKKNIRHLSLVFALLLILAGCAGLKSSTEITESSDEVTEDVAEATEAVVEEEAQAEPPSLARDETLGEEGLGERDLSGERLLDEEDADYFELPPIDEELIRLAEEDGRLYTIYFGYDSYALNDENKKKLKMNAKWLQEYPDSKLKIEGHADERGGDEYNLALGQRRAMGVQKFILDMGIPRERTVTISYGEEMPIDRNHNEEAWSKNRRADFLLVD